MGTRNPAGDADGVGLAASGGIAAKFSRSGQRGSGGVLSNSRLTFSRPPARKVQAGVAGASERLSTRRSGGSQRETDPSRMPHRD